MDIDGMVRLKYGAPSDIPQLPDDPDDGMVLYLLETDPYTQGPPNVRATMLDNKRYTMRDIGALDKRITNFDYSTHHTTILHSWEAIFYSYIQILHDLKQMRLKQLLHFFENRQNLNTE